MQSIIKILILLSLSFISYQDFKERKVYLLLFVTTGIALGYFHFIHVDIRAFFISSISNIGSILLIIFVMTLYIKYKMKISFDKAIGMGDILFFFVLALGFPTITFLVLFIFSIFFAAMVTFLVRKNISKNTIPLAGLQALFLALVFLVNWSFQITNLYLF